MITGIAQVALLVQNYDDAIDFYRGKLGFELVEDTPLSDKRWVRLRAPGGRGSELLLSLVADQMQALFVGSQAGGRVFLYLETDDFDRDYEQLSHAGVVFTEAPRTESYGKVAVLKDLYGNRIDLIQRT
jgi:catechol 2,3-dioxygenase-like lactoylglutathione lyase family enzyme